MLCLVITPEDLSVILGPVLIKTNKLFAIHVRQVLILRTQDADTEAGY